MPYTRQSRRGAATRAALLTALLPALPALSAAVDAVPQRLSCARGEFTSAGVRRTSGGATALRVCCDVRPGSLLIAQQGSAAGADRAVPCNPAAQPGMQGCCYDVTVGSSGGLDVVAAAPEQPALQESPDKWLFFEDDGESYQYWVPSQPGTFLESLKRCQDDGGMLFDLPQASVGPNVRAPRVLAQQQAGEDALLRALWQLPAAVGSDRQRLWLGAQTYPRYYETRAPPQAGPNFDPTATRPLIPAEWDECPAAPVWEASGLVHEEATGANVSAFGSCLAAKRPQGLALSGPSRPDRAALLTYDTDCAAPQFALCMKHRGFGRVADDAIAIQQPATYAQCRETCQGALGGHLVTPTTRFDRQLVYSMLRTDALVKQRTLHRAALRAWAGAYRGDGAAAPKWRWRGNGSVFEVNTTDSGWLEGLPGGGAATSGAWFSQEDLFAPQSTETVSIIGQHVGFGDPEPGCMYADEDQPGFVRSSVLYNWDPNADWKFRCACELPGARAPAAMGMASCSQGLAAVGLAPGADGLPAFAARCKGHTPAQLQAWRTRTVQDAAASGFAAEDQLGACTGGKAIEALEVTAEQAGLTGLAVVCRGEEVASNANPDWTQPAEAPDELLPSDEDDAAENDVRSNVSRSAPAPSAVLGGGDEDGGMVVRAAAISAAVAVVLLLTGGIAYLLYRGRRRGQRRASAISDAAADTPTRKGDLDAVPVWVRASQGGGGGGGDQRGATDAVLAAINSPRLSASKLWGKGNDSLERKAVYVPKSQRGHRRSGSAASEPPTPPRTPGTPRELRAMHSRSSMTGASVPDSPSVPTVQASYTSYTAFDSGSFTEMFQDEYAPGGRQNHSNIPGTEDADKFEQLDRQLDRLGDAGPFINRYKFKGPLARRRGGQGIVQFATGADGLDYAIKFYVHESAFAQEQALYKAPALRDILPPVAALFDNADGSLADAKGRPVAPFVIVEKGESLNEWARRRTPDFPTALTVLLHVAERLEKLHAVRVVHRDLKPENCLWLPSRNEWTLIDFGCAAEAHAQCPLTYSLRYAAPETIAAVEAGEASVRANEAVDCWALGVMAFELLTRRPAFEAQAGPHMVQQVTDKLAGREPLPWEPLAGADRRSLGVLRKSVMLMLARKPSKRPAMRDVVAMWHSLFAATTTTVAQPQASAGAAEVKASRLQALLGKR